MICILWSVIFAVIRGCIIFFNTVCCSVVSYKNKMVVYAFCNGITFCYGVGNDVCLCMYIVILRCVATI